MPLMLKIVGFFFVLTAQLINGLTYNEELFVENLSNSHVHLQFQFDSVWNDLNDDQAVKNYDLFPKRLGDIVSKFEIDELKLSLAQGTWKQDKWGLQSVSAPSGSELWGIFKNNVSPELVNEYWLQSSRTISGLFGLSINLKDQPNSVKPKFLQMTSENSSNPNTENLRYVTIPNEIVCTENLTPWLKLLPCGRTKGISQLFKNIPKLFESQYLLATMNFKQKCLDQECTKKRMELRQTLSLVYNLDLLKVKRTDNEIVWSFESIFSHSITGVCPVATSTRLFMDLGPSIAPTIPYTKKFQYSPNRNIYVHDIQKLLLDKPNFNPLIITGKNTKPLDNDLITIHRFTTDSNERNFGLKTLITNNQAKTLSVVYFDTIPWYFRVYINTLKIVKSGGEEVKPEKLHFTPGLDRIRPNHLELVINLAPKTIYSIYFKAEYAYLKWDEYPPDVNHGFYINPAMVSIRLNPNEHRTKQFRQFNLYSSLSDILIDKQIVNIQTKIINMYTETLLMNLPVPDFSMPYNVICLTCTVIAIAFGSLHNFTTRKFAFLETKTFKQKALEFAARIFGKKSSA